MKEKLDFVSWDSNLLDKPVFEINYENQLDHHNISILDKECQEKKTFMTFLKIKNADIATIHFLESLDFNYMESQFKIMKNMKGLLENNIYNRFFDLKKIDGYNKSEISSILRIINTTFTTDRYHLDPQIPRQKSNKRYENWFLNALNNEKYTTFIYQNKKNNEIYGFLMVKEEEGGIYLGLGGVNENYKGYGIYTNLLTDYLNYAYSIGQKKFQTYISSHNIAVFNIYIYFGFHITEETIVMRKIYEKH
jgi:ribosomal protein S18 acetylase RimI-like enzyme